jgi:hypothetical protein
MKSRPKLRKRVVPTLALAACMIPLAIAANALAVPQDLRSPDTKDAAAGISPQTQSAPRQDLRSPDTRDAAAGISHQTQSALARDVRSPDTRDAAAGIPRSGPGVAPASPAPATVVIEHGTQTLAIVFASTALGIALAGAAFMLLAVYRRPRRGWTAPY